MTSLEGKSFPAISNIPRRQELNGGREITLSFLRGDINDAFLSDIETGWTVNFKGDIYHLQNEREDRHGNKQFDGVLDFFHHFNGRWHVDEVDDTSMTIESSIRPLFQGSHYNLHIIDSFHANVMNYSRPQNSTQRFLYFIGRHRAEFDIPIGTQTVQVRNKIGAKRNDIILHEDDNLVDFNISTETGSFCTAIKGYYRFRPVDEDSHEMVPTREYDYISPMAAKYGVIWGEPIWDERFDTLEGIQTACQEKQESTWVSSFEIDAEAFEVPLGIGDELRFVVPSKEINGYIRVVEINEEFDEEGGLIRATYTFGNENIANGYRNLQYDAIDNLNDLLLGKSKLPLNVLPSAVRESTAVINAGVASSFEYRRNGIYGYNTDNPLGVTRYNANGIGFSTDGGQTFENALTYMGLTASAITTGTMLANRIAGGMLTSLNDNTEFDMNTGDLRMARSHFYLGNQNDTRVLDMKDGEIESIYNGELSMKFGGFSMDFYNHRTEPIGRVMPLYSVGDNRPGLGLIVDTDIVNVGYFIQGLYRPVLRADRKENTTWLSGPFNNANDGASLGLYANRRIVSSDTNFENDYRAVDQPSFVLDQSSTTNHATLYYGGVNNRAGAEFRVRWRVSQDNFINRLVAHADGVILSGDITDSNGNAFYASGTGSRNLNSAGALHANGIGAFSGSNFYVGTLSGGELRVSSRSGSNNDSPVYRDIRFRNWTAVSSEKFKEDISIWDYDVLEVIKHGMTIYQYKYKRDGDDALDDAKDFYQRGLIVERDTPVEWIAGDGINQYEVTSWALKGIQQLALISEDHEDRIQKLEEMCL